MRWLALPLVIAFVAACSGSDKPKNDLASGCDPKKDSTCGHATKPPPPGEDDPVGTPTPGNPEPIPDPDKPTSSNKDAGVDAAAAALGPDCTKLSTCCDQLAEAGYDTTTCKSVLSTHNDAACYAQYDRYKSTGDCS